jgi:hypothetical protein
MSTLFNRKDTSVIEFALSNELEAFLNEYSTTTASQETLTKAYNEIVGNKTKSKIAVASGDGVPTEPLKAVTKKAAAAKKTPAVEQPTNVEGPSGYALDSDGELKKIDMDAVPEKGASKGTTKAAAAKEAVAKDKKPKATAKKEKTASTGPTKRDAIRALIAAEGGATLTNRQIKDAIIAQGYPSCYDSEIASSKK